MVKLESTQILIFTFYFLKEKRRSFLHDSLVSDVILYLIKERWLAMIVLPNIHTFEEVH